MILAYSENDGECLKETGAMSANTNWTREGLITNGVRLENIEGLYRSEEHPATPESMQYFVKRSKAQFSYEEVYGDYCTVHLHINCPVDQAWKYAANPYSLEEWTYTVRDLVTVKDTLMVGREALVPNTKIYVKTESHEPSGVVDYLCAWDQGQELWMRYYCRFIDSMPTFGKPGTVMIWTNCRHPNYLRDSPNKPQHVVESQSRKDRPWVGDVWNLFAAGHLVEAENMKYILEARFKNR
jgi:hypothetical protein